MEMHIQDKTSRSRGGTPERAAVRLLCGFLLLVLGSAGCEENHATRPSDPYQRWRSYGLHDYTIHQKLSCFCVTGGQSMEITVRSDTIANIVRLSDSTALAKNLWPAYRTIESLFSIIATTGSDSVVVTYDGHYGFPSSLDHYPQLHPVDGGVLYETSMARVP
jgi:hypothetical protein